MNKPILYGFSIFVYSVFSACFAFASDPTRPEWSFEAPPTGSATAQEKTPTVTLIRSSGKQRTAVINGKLVQEGQLFNEYKVLRILEDKVVLSKKGQELTLNLYPKILKTVAQ